MPPRRGEALVVLRVAIVLGLLVVAMYLGLVLGYGSLPGPGTGREVELDWPPEPLSPEAVAARLVAAGLVADPAWFALYLRVTGRYQGVRPGHHLFADDMAPASIAKRMQSSSSRGHTKVVLREGTTRFDLAKRLQAARVAGMRAFLAASTDRALLSELGIADDSAEGYLFPATYDLPLDSEPREVVERLKAEFDRRFERALRDHAAGFAALKATLGWGPREVVILASMIEKEAMADEERPVIASVFLNRLRDPSFSPKRLQSDPTAGYGCLVRPDLYACRDYAGRITPEMNADDANPYTTYRHDGLPPGPICCPGDKSLVAVLAPAETRYFFFVARGDGRHTFSETLAQHNEAIRRGRTFTGP